MLCGHLTALRRAGIDRGVSRIEALIREANPNLASPPLTPLRCLRGSDDFCTSG
jgi:hypothetical protein